MGDTARHYRQRYHLCARLLGYPLRHLFGELGLPHDNGNVLRLHRPYQLLDMARGGVNAWPQLYGAEIDHAEALREVRPVLVIGDELHAFEGACLLLPFRDLRVQPRKIGVSVAGVVCLVLRVKGDEGVINVCDGRLCEYGVEHVVGVAVWMDVARVVLGGFRHIHGDYALRAVYVALGVDLDAWVLACLDEGGKKGVLAIETDEEQEVRPVHRGHEARLHGYAVRVFDARCKAFHVYEVAAYVAGKVGEVRERCHDADLSRSGGRNACRKKHRGDEGTTG